MILSQYKRKVFVKLGQDIKPVIMLKSKSIKDNKANYEAFKERVATLKLSDISNIRNRAKEDLLAAFDYDVVRSLHLGIRAGGEGCCGE